MYLQVRVPLDTRFDVEVLKDFLMKYGSLLIFHYVIAMEILQHSCKKV